MLQKSAVNILLDCGQPVLSLNVSVVSTTGTNEGDTVTLQCEDAVIPVIITCNSAGVWSPNPAEFVCNNNVSGTTRLNYMILLTYYECRPRLHEWMY